MGLRRSTTKTSVLIRGASIDGETQFHIEADDFLDYLRQKGFPFSE
jgi:hypothetical protein